MATMKRQQNLGSIKHEPSLHLSRKAQKNEQTQMHTIATSRLMPDPLASYKHLLFFRAFRVFASYYLWQYPC
jgi:hypothetical protein